MNAPRRLMKEAVERGVFPSGVLLVGSAVEVLFEEAYGLAVPGTGEAAATGAFYDLASLTKPLAAATSAMILAESGRLLPESALGELLPGVFGKDKAGITVAQLLSHASGLPAYRHYYRKLQFLPAGKRRGRLLKLIAAESLESAPGTRAVYSDLGYMLLLEILEKAAGMDLDGLFREAVAEPLGIGDLFFIPLESGLMPAFLRKREALMAGRSFAATEACPWRGRLLVGEVHDDNAWVTGGVAAHAGLFGTARAVWELVSALVRAFHGEQAGLFLPETVRSFLTRREAPGSFVMGFDTPTRPGSSSGRFFSDLSVGHLGFTGASFWADLEKRVIVVLLTNRVHPTRKNEEIRAFRPLIHDAVMEELGFGRAEPPQGIRP